MRYFADGTDYTYSDTETICSFKECKQAFFDKYNLSFFTLGGSNKTKIHDFLKQYLLSQTTKSSVIAGWQIRSVYFLSADLCTVVSSTAVFDLGEINLSFLYPFSSLNTERRTSGEEVSKLWRTVQRELTVKLKGNKEKKKLKIKL